MLRVESVQQLPLHEALAGADDTETQVVVGKKAPKNNMSSKRAHVLANSSTECTTMAFITKIANKNHMESRGVWSRYGQPYVPHGAPDLELAERVRKGKLERQEKRQNRFSENKSKRGSGSNTSKKKELALKQLKESEFDDGGIGKPEVNTEKYRFPRDALFDAEERCRKARIGTLLTEAKKEATSAHASFPALDMTKVAFDETPSHSSKASQSKDARKSGNFQGFQARGGRGLISGHHSGNHRGIFFAHGSSNASKDESSNSPVKKAARTKKKVAKTPKERPCERWRRKFVETREAQERKLQETLVRKRMNMEDVFRDKDLLGRVTTIAHQRAGAGPQYFSGSVWSQARKEKKQEDVAAIPVWDISTADDRTRKEFYRELLVFIERRHSGDTPASANAATVAAVNVVKDLIENRVRITNGNIFFEALQKFGANAYEKHEQMEVLLYLRRRSGIRDVDFHAFRVQTGWHFPKNVLEKLDLESLVKS